MPELTVVFLDSGQGECILVSFPSGELMLVDCGSIKNSAVVKPQIVAGIERFFTPHRRHIDMVVITHPDADHYNMLSPVMNSFAQPTTVGDVWYGGDINLYKNRREKNAAYDWLIEKNATNFSPSHFGAANPITLGVANTQSRVYVLAANASGNPSGASGWLKNTNSVVLMIEYQGYKVFLMGDATSQTEQFILDRVAAAGAASPVAGLLNRTYATSLKMGHHGSDTSSSQQWVERIAPDAAFISADTRPFGRRGSGIPTLSHLENVIRWSPNLREEDQHVVVVFDDLRPIPRFEVFNTKRRVYSTLWELEYNMDETAYEAAGGSWFLFVRADGSVSVQRT